jgi:hypothetical protein
MGSSIVVAQRGAEKLICKTNGVSYTPDILRHKYGDSSRRPLEDWFLDELRFFQSTYPKHNIFTLGSSLVFGEKFITYLTICEFTIRGSEDHARLVEALKASDRAIRMKLSAMWKWDLAAERDNNIVFMVGWLDFAYFLQHRSDFMDKTHGHYMRQFIPDQSAITSRDYKVLHDGTIVPFDPEKLGAEDRKIYENPWAIQYERIRTETLL